MPPVADITNSYSDLATAVTYFDTRLHTSAWDDATEDDQNRALIQSTRIFDSLLTWEETPDKEAPAQAIIDATCEMALVLIQGDTQVIDDMAYISDLGLGDLKLKGTGRVKATIPSHVFALISHLAEKKLASGSYEVLRS